MSMFGTRCCMFVCFWQIVISVENVVSRRTSHDDFIVPAPHSIDNLPAAPMREG